MAQNITLMGASYSDVPAVILPKTGGGTARFDDASVTTATAADVASGKIFLASDGTITTGTASGGGGSSSWTKVCDITYSNVSTTSTTVSSIETWATGHSEIWQSNKWVYIKVRDTAGKRDGYFYGSDNFFINPVPLNGDTLTNYFTTFLHHIIRYSSSSYSIYTSTGSTGYGVYPDLIYDDGRIRMRKRYSSSNSLTVNGTYKVEVYLLDPPSAIFT